MKAIENQKNMEINKSLDSNMFQRRVKNVHRIEQPSIEIAAKDEKPEDMKEQPATMNHASKSQENLKISEDEINEHRDLGRSAQKFEKQRRMDGTYQMPMSNREYRVPENKLSLNMSSLFLDQGSPDSKHLGRSQVNLLSSDP